jgi:prevent-host-death family protein
MIDVTQDIHSLTDFKRNAPGLLRQMKAHGRPLVLTVNGKAEVVVVDASEYQAIAEHMDTVTRIRAALAEARLGLGELAGDVFDELENEL